MFQGHWKCITVERQVARDRRRVTVPADAQDLRATLSLHPFVQSLHMRVVAHAERAGDRPEHHHLRSPTLRRPAVAVDQPDRGPPHHLPGWGLGRLRPCGATGHSGCSRPEPAAYRPERAAATGVPDRGVRVGKGFHDGGHGIRTLHSIGLIFDDTPSPVRKPTDQVPKG